MFCGNCGTVIPEGAAFCPVCGQAAGEGLLPNLPNEGAGVDMGTDTVSALASADTVSVPPSTPAPAPEAAPVAAPADNAPDSVVPEGSISSKIWKKTGSTMDKITMDKLRPVFVEDIKHSGIGMGKPALAMIAARDKKHEHELCEGSVGHVSKAASNEVLVIYPEGAAGIPLKFIPEIRKNALYISHPRKPGIYIMMQYYFRNFEEEHMAELRQIAASLNASRCTITIEEELPDMYLEVPESSGISLGGLFKRKKETEEEKTEEREIPHKIVYRDDVTFEARSGGPAEPAPVLYAANDSVRQLIMEGMKQKIRYADAVHNLADTMVMTANKASGIDESAEELGFKTNFTLFSMREACKRSRIVVHVEF